MADLALQSTSTMGDPPILEQIKTFENISIKESKKYPDEEPPEVTAICISESLPVCNPLTKSMYEMAKQKQFCDSEIISSEGQSFSAHSTVLASRCEMLKEVFCLSSTTKFKIRTEEICGSTWKLMLEYIYLGSVDIEPCNIKDLLEAADALEMEDLKTKCKTELEIQTALGNIDTKDTSDQQTEIEPDLMKFAAGLSDTFEFVSTVNDDQHAASSSSSNGTNTGINPANVQLLHGSGPECTIQVDETQGSVLEDNKAVYYMIQEQPDGGQTYIISTEEPEQSTSSFSMQSHVEAIATDKPEINENRTLVLSTEPAASSSQTNDKNQENRSLTNQEKTNVMFPAGLNVRSQGRPKTKDAIKKVYKCGICGKIYNSKQSLERHIFLHGNVHPFTCDQCGKSFKTERYLKCHIMRHSDDRSYQCPICGKSFKTPRDANWHTKTVHTENRPFQCQYCPYTSKTRALLNQHMHSHTNAKQWNCKTCGKSFLRKQHLEQHATRHEGKRQYMCSTCGSEFYTIYACKEHHMRVHQGIKKYECSVCHQQYNEKKSFMKHLQKHSVDLVLKLDGGDIIIEQTVEETA